MKWIKYAESVFESEKSRLRMSGIAIKIVRSDAETVPRSAIALGQWLGGRCGGVALLGNPADC